MRSKRKTDGEKIPFLMSPDEKKAWAEKKMWQLRFRADGRVLLLDETLGDYGDAATAYFVTKDAAKRVRDEMSPDGAAKWMVSRGPDHPDYLHPDEARRRAYTPPDPNSQRSKMKGKK